MATLERLPTHVWAIVLQHVTVSDIFTLAHVCRTLHALVTSRDTCHCGCADGPFVEPPEEENGRTRAFWAHVSDARTRPAADQWNDAISNGRPTYVAYALRAGVDSTANDQWALRKASAGGHRDVVDRLLRDPRVDPAAQGQQAIQNASKNGHVRTVQRLLQDARVDPSAKGQRALVSASASGHAGVVECLLRDDRVDPTHDKSRALRVACERGHAGVVECFVSDGRADPAGRHQWCIRLACDDGYADVVERLLRDPRVDPSVNKQAMLLLACDNDDVRVVDVLLRDDRVARDYDAIRCILQGCRQDGTSSAIVASLERALRARKKERARDAAATGNLTSRFLARLRRAAPQ